MTERDIKPRILTSKGSPYSGTASVSMTTVLRLKRHKLEGIVVPTPSAHLESTDDLLKHTISLSFPVEGCLPDVFLDSSVSGTGHPMFNIAPAVKTGTVTGYVDEDGESIVKVMLNPSMLAAACDEIAARISSMGYNIINVKGLSDAFTVTDKETGKPAILLNMADVTNIELRY